MYLVLVTQWFLSKPVLAFLFLNDSVFQWDYKPSGLQEEHLIQIPLSLNPLQRRSPKFKVHLQRSFRSKDT